MLPKLLLDVTYLSTDLLESMLCLWRFTVGDMRHTSVQPVNRGTVEADCITSPPVRHAPGPPREVSERLTHAQSTASERTTDSVVGFVPKPTRS